MGKRLKIMLLALVGCCLLAAMPAQADVGDKLLGQRLSELDEMLRDGKQQLRMQELRIAQCRGQMQRNVSQEEHYRNNLKLYQHYMVYDSDPAMCLINCNLQIAHSLGRKDWQADCMIEKSFIFTATGMLKEAEDELDRIDTSQLPYESLLNYYDKKIYMYSHCSQYQGYLEDALGNEYYLKEMAYRDSIDCLIKPEHPMYLWYKGWMALYKDQDMTDVVRMLKAVVDSAPMESRLDAMNAYVLARLYE